MKKRKSNGDWVRLDRGTGDGINLTTTIEGSEPRKLCYGDSIYVTWYEDNGTTSKLVARKFLTTTTTVTSSLEGWTSLHSTGLNANQNSGTVNRPAIGRVGTNIYVLWEENDASNGNRHMIKFATIE